VFSPSAKDLIKSLLLQHPNLDVAAITQALAEQEISISRVTIAGIRQAFRDDLKFLAERGLLRVERPNIPARAVSAQRQSILAAVREAATPIGPNAIADQCSMECTAVRYLLHHMVRDQQIERVGHGRYRVRK
jgi:hypothetical protein